MYRFSRSIYRELAPRVMEDDRDETGCRNKQQVLDACEAARRGPLSPKLGKAPMDQQAQNPIELGQPG